MQKTLGLDFGHCEVAMSLTLDGKKPENLVLDGNKEKVIPAQITLQDRQIAALAGKTDWELSTLQNLGTIQIGNAATPKNDETVDATNFLYFKKSPAHFLEVYEGKLPHGALMAAYLYQLIEQVFVYNPDYLGPEDRGNVALVVGCPTTQEWTSDENRKQYQQLIRNATGIQNVSIVPESRAAMFSSIESAQTCVSAADGAVVFDFGSSTADCTYMLSGRRCIEYSWTLGAQEIEKQMTKVALDGQKASLLSRIFVTSQLRKQKELFYSGQFGPKGQRIFLDITDKDGKEIEAYIRVNADQMEEVVNSEEYEFTVLCDSKSNMTGPWRALCRKFFEAAKELFRKEGLPCKNIVLTGGASKMDFVKEECRAVFGTDVEIHLEQNPSYSVANGLGWVSAIDARIPEVLAESRKKLLDNQDISIRALTKKMAVPLQEIVSEVAIRHADAWAAQEGEIPAADLLQAIRDEMETEEMKAIIDQQLKVCIAEWKVSFEKEVRSVVNENTPKLMSKKIADGVTLPMNVWNSLDMTMIDGESIGISRVVDNLNLDSTMNFILQRCTVWICICIGNAILPGLGALIGWLLGEGLAEVMKDTNVAKPRNQRARARISDGLKRGVRSKSSIDKMAESIFEQFKELDEQYPQIVEEVLTAAYDVVTLKHFAK